MNIPFFGRRQPTIQEQAIAKLTEQAAAKVLESINLMANYVDPRERVDADGTMWTRIGGLGNTDDGHDPQDLSYITDETELTDVRNLCRLLAMKNPFAINLHENMVSYIIGAGDSPTVVAQKGQAVDENALKHVQEILDEWIYETDWVTKQQQSVRRYDRDGEFFRRFFTGSDGNLQVRFVEPNQVSQPDGKRKAEHRFGIHTDPDDVETVLGYWIDGEEVPADEIQHVKANVDCNVRRGIPTTWPIRKFLEDAVLVLENIAVTSQIQTAIALIVRTEGSTTAGNQALRASAADWTAQNPDTGKTDHLEQTRKGKIIRTNAKSEYDFPAAGLNVESYGFGVQSILRAAASRVCFPEFMFTSDASNANYASTMVAEGPAVRMFQRRQKTHGDADLKVLWRVLEAKAEAGAFDKSLLERIEIVTEPPTVQVRDEKAEAETAKLLIELKLLSPQTASSRFKLEYQQEQENIEQHEKDHPDQMQQAELQLNQAQALPTADAANLNGRSKAMEHVARVIEQFVPLEGSMLEHCGANGPDSKERLKSKRGEFEKFEKPQEKPAPVAASTVADVESLPDEAVISLDGVDWKRPWPGAGFWQCSMGGATLKSSEMAFVIDDAGDDGKKALAKALKAAKKK